MTEKRCRRCEVGLKEHRATLQHPYRYSLSGLDNLYLAGVVVRKCGKCGAEAPVIPKLGELHGVVAKALLQKSARLSGKELRFLRKNAGVSAADFASLLGVDPAHLSRFENGATQQLGASTDKLARAVVGAMMDVPHDLRRILMEAAKKLERHHGRRPKDRPTFKLERDRWRAA